ncbi:catalase-like [Mixophyes fleayi]|uniref:catalase-like n=1 Tax=Mixophyes fleayi TaxID=3061075 RepID=UPI003F4DC759
MCPRDVPKHKESTFSAAGDIDRHDSAVEENVLQVRSFYNKTLNEAERQRLCENLALHLKDAQIFIQERAVKNFRDVDPDYGNRIQTLLDKHNASSGQKEPLHNYTRCPCPCPETK